MLIKIWVTIVSASQDEKFMTVHCSSQDQLWKDAGVLNVSRATAAQKPKGNTFQRRHHLSKVYRQEIPSNMKMVIYERD